MAAPFITVSTYTEKKLKILAIVLDQMPFSEASWTQTCNLKITRPQTSIYRCPSFKLLHIILIKQKKKQTKKETTTLTYLFAIRL